jgi:hypothetical protein
VLVRLGATAVDRTRHAWKVWESGRSDAHGAGGG